MPRAKKIKMEKATMATEAVALEKTVAPKKLFGAKLIFGAMLFVIVTGAIGFGGYFYLQYQKMLKNQPVVAQSETQLLTEKIGKFVDLPTDEEPTIAEVKDLEKLKGQAFFTGAQNGDKVLIYTKNKKAVLYRPTTDKIIEVTSLGMKAEAVSAPATEEDAAQSAPAENASEEKPEETLAPTSEEIIEPVKVVVYNGAKTKGLAGKLGEQISNGVEGTEILETGNAVGNYSETIVVDLTGNNTKAVEKIIAVIGGKSGELPAGEIKPEGDILVIGGEK